MLFREELLLASKINTSIVVDLFPVSIVDFDLETIDHCHYSGLIYDKMVGLLWNAMDLQFG